jgi:hypothetical protein
MSVVFAVTITLGVLVTGGILMLIGYVIGWRDSARASLKYMEELESERR